MSDLDRYQYGYDQNSNRLYKANVVGTSAVGYLDEGYTYDNLNRLIQMQRGNLSGGVITGTPTREMDYTLDPTGIGLHKERGFMADNEMNKPKPPMLTYREGLPQAQAEFLRRRKIKIAIAVIASTGFLGVLCVCLLGIMAFTEAGTKRDESSQHLLDLYVLGFFGASIPVLMIGGYIIVQIRSKPSVE